MGSKIIQEQFGESIIAAIRDFARSDLETVPEMEQKYFNHVSDGGLQRALAETLYGARWLYKLGLALLVQDAEQMAHVRAQVIDYGSICEGLLHDAIAHALRNGLLRGHRFRYSDTRNLRFPINWTLSHELVLKRQGFQWHIDVAEEEGIIDGDLAAALHDLRKERNTVHVKSRTYQAFIGTSRRAFGTMCDSVKQTRGWKHAHI